MKPHVFPVTILSLWLVGQAFAGKTIPDFPDANLALGQTTFTSDEVADVQSSFTMRSPRGIVVDPMSGKVFVADFNNNRVLRFPSITSLHMGAGAQAVFGHARFSDTTTGSGDQGLNGPVGLCFDRMGRLWVADSGNNRVLMFEAAVYRGDEPYADRVFGQSSFSTSTGTTSNTGMKTPYGVWVDDDDRLWVADAGNNRVINFDSVSNKPNGSAANGVLGQPGLFDSDAAATRTGMDFPTSVTVSKSGTLFVSDFNNNRVLRFDDAANLADGAEAASVLGQKNFTFHSPGLRADKMDGPTGVFITPSDTLWVSEQNNNRVTRFDKASTKAIGSSANGVVGQPDLNTRVVPVIATIGAINGNITTPFVDGTGDLWIADTGNNRTLRFPSDDTKPVLQVTGTVPTNTSLSKITISGTASDAFGISKVQYKINTGGFKTATGKASWKFDAPLIVGTNKITIQAVDAVGNKSTQKVLKVTRKP